MDQAQSNIEAVEATLRSIEQGDFDGALGRFEEDARWDVSSFLPQAGWHDGTEAIKKLLGAMRERFPTGYRHLGLTVYGTPDHVFAETTRAAGPDPEGTEHVLLSFQLVMGRIRGVKEFVF